jgi:predicted Zn-dependent protease
VIRAIVAGAAALLAAGAAMAGEPVPAGSPSLAGYQPIGRDEQGIWAQADEAERAFKTSKTVIRDPALNAYLRGVLCRTVGAAHCGAVRLYVVRSPVFNAFTMPNGAIVIFTGALLRVRDEAELSAILAHEFTHFEHRHSLSGLRSQRSATSWGAWLTMVSFATTRPYDYSSGFVAAHYGFARDQERDADVTSVALMHDGGFRPGSASMVWAQMREEEDHRAAALGVKSLKDAWRGPFSTHPMDAERMTYLKAAAERFGPEVRYTGEAEYRAALASIWPTLIADQIKLNDFGGSEYLLANLAEAGWTGPLLYARGELYRTRGSAADLLFAESYYRQAIAAGDAPAETWRGFALVEHKLGNAAASREAVAEYVRRRPDAGDRAVLQAMGDEG